MKSYATKEPKQAQAAPGKGHSASNPLQLFGRIVQAKDEDEELQMKRNPLQLQAAEEELQMKAAPAQLQDDDDDEDALQMKVNPLQKKEGTEQPAADNKTGMPDTLKDGVENLSGMAMDDVKVHRNSEKPAGVGALAYAQGTDIHVAPGQDHHLPHEAWHVVQQKQGRVQATVQRKGVAVNDDAGLETEADVMGAKAAQMKPDESTEP